MPARLLPVPPRSGGLPRPSSDRHDLRADIPAKSQADRQKAVERGLVPISGKLCAKSGRTTAAALWGIHRGASAFNHRAEASQAMHPPESGTRDNAHGQA